MKLIDLKGKKFMSKASVPAGKEATLKMGVLDISFGIETPTGDTSKITEGKYKQLRQPLDSEPLTYNITGWHSTSLDYWKSIRRYGLIPGKSDAPGQTWAPHWKNKATYFHLSFPGHELDNSFDPDSGEPYALVIETKLHGYPGYFVPDEEVSKDLDYTPKAIKNGEAIAYGYIVPPSEFQVIHLVGTEAARKWAVENCKGFTVKFHKAN